MSRIVLIIIFSFSLLSLIISLNLFWNMGIFVDEAGLSPTDVTGNDFWLYMDWLRLLLLTIITILSGTSLFKK